METILTLKQGRQSAVICMATCDSREYWDALQVVRRLTTKKAHNLALCARDLKLGTFVPDTSTNNLRSGCSRSPAPHPSCGGNEPPIMVSHVIGEFLTSEKTFSDKKCSRYSKEQFEIGMQLIVCSPPLLWGKWVPNNGFSHLKLKNQFFEWNKKLTSRRGGGPKQTVTVEKIGLSSGSIFHDVVLKSFSYVVNP